MYELIGALLVTAAPWTVAPEDEASEPPPDAASLSADQLEGMSLEELLDIPVTVASGAVKKAQTIRDSPGVITVFTREEIERSGARDLIDILHLVPGFDFAMDVQGVVGLSFRGNWAHEGKVLVLIDGQELNETLYNTTHFDGHFDADLIERVEIIRGPGSAVYGGYAELAVVAIETRRPAENGFTAMVAARYGQRPRNFARREISLLAGYKTESGLELSLSGRVGQGTRSDKTYTDVYGDAYDMGPQSGLLPAQLNFGLKIENLSLRFLFDRYVIEGRDGYDAIDDQVSSTEFTNFFAEARYDWKVLETLTITPKLTFKHALPWRTVEEHTLDSFYYDKRAQRLVGHLSASWDPLEALNIVAGAEFTYDRAYLEDPTQVDVGFNTAFGYEDEAGTIPITEVSYNNLAGFTQILFKNDIANLTLGLRAENHSQYGASFVPRAAITKVAGPIHFKLLFATAFKAPGIENINLNPDITPERTRVLELELGYRINDNIYVVANGFDITIEDPITYFYDEINDTEGYVNFDETGTRGLEVELRFKYDWGFANIAYSHYNAGGKNLVPTYVVPDHPELLLGTPAHKLTLNSSFKITDHLFLSPSMIYLSPRHTITSVDPNTEEPVYEALDHTVLVNLHLSLKDLPVEGLEIGLAGYNILNQDFAFPQPYTSLHAPLPARGPEIALHVAYNRTF